MNETLKLENKTAKISEAQSPPRRLRKKTVLLFFFKNKLLKFRNNNKDKSKTNTGT